MAVMGFNLARNFARKDFVTAIHNRSNSKTEAVIAEHGSVDPEYIESVVSTAPNTAHMEHVGTDTGTATEPGTQND
jgi:6-phosphogluconate dehydrogenase